MTTAVIPARGGSKGIPRKNLQRLGSETLLGRCIRKCKRVCREVVVSSEDVEILAEAAECGVIALRRPDLLATDDASSPNVLRHARDELGIGGQMAFVQCTAPFFTEQDLLRCCEPTEADLSVCVHPFSGFVLDGDGRCLNHDLIPVPRRQDLLTQYVISGSVWAFDASYLDYDFYSGTVRVVPSEGRQLDIDTPEDLRLAEAIVQSTTASMMPDMELERWSFGGV